ncbi:non-heme iron oxygenase ferredoxin subunit [Ilumatobacter sp.]|uniref:non-heme iron oxygenase ferredoxin subunit n=1 Tax=Ilumatobacter sp. TaxID=1967498 RepID=UPI003B519BD0
MTDVGSLDDFADGTATRVEVDGAPVAVVRCGDDLHAIGDVCSHANVSLSGGEVWCDELELECPKHASAFSLTTGRPSTLPATQPVAVHDVEVRDGRVQVTLRPGAPGAQDPTTGGRR